MRFIAPARVHLNGEEWTKAWDEGRPMALEQAIAFALKEAGS
jgi:hypothetical protein